MKSPKSRSRRAVALGIAALSSSASSASVQTATNPLIKRVNPPGLPAPRGYSQVVAASGGRTIYVSGQVSMNAKGEIVGKGDLKAQTIQVFENLRTALAAVGALPKDVVKMTIFVPDFKADGIGVIRDVRNGFFDGAEPPASTFVAISALANPDWMLEIEMIAVV